MSEPTGAVGVDPVESRRPLATRSARWAQALARALTRRGIRPNTISLMSVVFAALAALLTIAGLGAREGLGAFALVAAAACIQLRLLCNMLDGMVAVEGGLGTKSGDVWNEVPDRIADVLIFLGAGYGAGGYAIEAGWCCATLAVITAYVRALGSSKGLPADFGGPMAKPHRMAAMTLTLLVVVFLSPSERPAWIRNALVAIAALTALTAVLRTLRLVRRLEAR